jgi:PAS domain S-box-containing protein
MEIPRITPAEVDVQATLRMILKDAVEALAGSAGVVASWIEAERCFVVTDSYRLDVKALDRLRPLLDEALPDLAGSKQSFNLLSELRHHPPLPSSDRGVALNPVIALPLQIGKTSVGLICVLRESKAVPFTGLDQPTLAAFARQAALAIHNARLAHLLYEENRRMESMLEGSGEGIMSIDAQRRIVGFNAAMERLTGYSREAALGQPCSKILNLHEWDGKSFCNRKCPMLMPFEGHLSTLEAQGTLQSADGQDIDVAMLYSIVCSPERRQPAYAVINVRDISRLREIENLRSTFLSMLGHELQTPLSIIKGYTSTLARSDGNWNNEIVHEGLRVVEEECDRLSKLVNRLLLASRIETGTLTLRKEALQLPALASKVVRRFQPLTSIHTFEMDFEQDLPAPYADPQLIEEVLANLIDNAIKYSPKGGKIVIAGRTSHENVEVTVTDEGIGIPLREMGHIFERFRRVNDSFVQKTRGVGLGLSICKYIVEAHGGRINVVSRLGQGSQFTFAMPLS